MTDTADNMNPNIAIIILNWNGWEDTIECLKSLYQINYENYEVILIDNDSEDDSINEIRKFCTTETNLQFNGYKSNIQLFELEEKNFNDVTLDLEPLTNSKLFLLKNSENYGYAKGNNIGIRFAFRVFNPDYILLLNNDTIVDENFLKELTRAAENQEKVGIYSPKLLNADDPKIIDSTGHIITWGRIVDRGHGKIDRHQYDQEINVMGAKGAGAFYKREMLESIGLLKESYITSYEDAELSWRANKNSWKAFYVPNSVIYHKGWRSIKKDSSKWFYFWGLSLKNVTSTVNEYGTFYQKLQFSVFLIYFMIGSFLLRITRIRDSKVNYAHLLKELYK